MTAEQLARTWEALGDPKAGRAFDGMRALMKAPEARLTREAKAALARLSRRSATRP